MPTHSPFWIGHVLVDGNPYVCFFYPFLSSKEEVSKERDGERESVEKGEGREGKGNREKIK